MWILRVDARTYTCLTCVFTVSVLLKIYVPAPIVLATVTVMELEQNLNWLKGESDLLLDSVCVPFYYFVRLFGVRLFI